MKTFSVPVILTVSGWVKIEANSLAEALEKGRKLNDEGVDTDSIEDPSYSSECELEEIAEV